MVYGSILAWLLLARTADWDASTTLTAAFFIAMLASVGLVFVVDRLRLPIEPSLTIVVVALGYVAIMLVPTVHAASCWDCRDGDWTRAGSVILTYIVFGVYTFVVAAVVGALTGGLTFALRAVEPGGHE